MRRRQKEKLSRKQRRIRSRVTFRTLFLLSITLIFNTYAWFLYTTTAMTAHVDSWKVEFEADGESVTTSVNFVVAHAYPGMPNSEKELTVRNTGEKAATITYEVQSYRIMDDVFISSEEVALGATVPTGATTNLTAAQLLSKLQNDYPFNFEVDTGSGSLAINASTIVTLTFGWDYESGDDETDTDYGVAAYQYYEENEGEPAIEIVIKVTVTQSNS